MFGNAASVLVGDFLYSRAFQMMVGVESMRVMQVLADATNIIAEGEVLQLLNCHNADVEVDDYLQVIRFKTAKLFEARRGSAAFWPAPARRLKRGWRRSACTSEPPSSSSMTCSTIRAKRPTPASISATIWPKASPRCR
jgi:hypothetical protein